MFVQLQEEYLIHSGEVQLVSSTIENFIYARLLLQSLLLEL